MLAAKIYHLIHLTGAFMIMLGYGALLARAMTGSENKGLRKLGAITSGVGLFFMLLGGFGLLARMYDNQWEGWVVAKLIIWVILGGLIAFINRKPQAAKTLWWVTLLLGATAVFMVYFRPF